MDDEVWQAFLDAEVESQRFGAQARAAHDEHSDARPAVFSYRGHIRLTALMLDPPEELDVIVAFSDDLASWTSY
jgi:hypothetical protein